MPSLEELGERLLRATEERLSACEVKLREINHALNDEAEGGFTGWYSGLVRRLEAVEQRLGDLTTPVERVTNSEKPVLYEGPYSGLPEGRLFMWLDSRMGCGVWVKTLHGTAHGMGSEAKYELMRLSSYYVRQVRELPLPEVP